ALLGDPALALALVLALAVVAGGLAFRLALAGVDAGAFHGAVLGGEGGGGGRSGREHGEGRDGCDGSEVPAIHVPVSLGFVGVRRWDPRGDRNLTALADAPGRRGDLAPHALERAAVG